jgi:putative DNA primase/helicase
MSRKKVPTAAPSNDVIDIDDAPESGPRVSSIGEGIWYNALQKKNVFNRQTLEYETKVTNNFLNACITLEKHPDMVGVLAFDEFRYETVMLRPPPWAPNLVIREGGQPWEDHNDWETKAWFDKLALPMSPTCRDIGAAVELAARKKSFHPIRDYLNGLTWDGIPRIDSWLIDYLGADVMADDGSGKVDPRRDAYVRKVGAFWLVSAVARVFAPGCKVDTILVLEGEQGAKKSSAIGILCGERYFLEDMRDLGHGVEGLKQLQGKWIVELQELDSFQKSAASAIKAFLSKKSDNYRGSYGKRTKDFPRQCGFAGTINTRNWMRDATGGRRFWPVWCKGGDYEALRRDRDQIWAEALARYKIAPVWWFESNDPILETALAEADNRNEDGVWDNKIAAYLARNHRDGVTAEEVLFQGIGIEPHLQDTRKQREVTSYLRRAKWEKRRMPEPPGGGPRPWRYFPPLFQ